MTSWAQTVVLSESWQIPAGERAYLTNSGNFERGAAVNPSNGHVYVVSRNGGLQVAILDGNTGAELGFLDTTGLSGGVFALSTVGVADDGAIYGANLVTAAGPGTGAFKLYRWADEASSPVVAYEGSPSDGMRFGDSLDVRGQGASTQIAAGSSGTATTVRFAVFTTTDGQNFQSHAFSPANIGAGDFQKGITFGEGNSVYGKSNGRNVVRKVGFDTSTGSSSTLVSIPVATNISPIDFHPAFKLLAGVDYAAHELLIYDISNEQSPVQIAGISFPSPVTANGNGVGAVDFASGKLLALDTQNGLVAVSVTQSEQPEPPALIAQPVSQSTLEGGPVTLSVGATGTKPLNYQWFKGENPIPNATDATYSIERAQTSDAGSYTVVVTNAVGSETSNEAVLTVIPLVKSGILQSVLSLGPGDVSFLATDNAQRGAAYNPVSGRVVVASRTEGDNIHVLDTESGQEIHRLRTTDASGEPFIFGGFYPINMVVVADDGAVYACNLSLSGADFTLYRWADDGPDALPELAFLGDTTVGRSGDSIAVRGSGINTEILVASRNGTQAVVFRTFDGVLFEPYLINVEGIENGDIGLGITFGEGDTFWATAPGRQVRHIAFDINTATGTVVRSLGNDWIPSSAAALAYDASNSFLAALTLETPHTVRLYDMSNPDEPVLVDQELFKAFNPNVNGTGALDFGADRLFALNSNNGLAVFEVDPDAQPVSNPASLSLSWGDTAGSLILNLTGTPQTAYELQKSVDLKDWLMEEVVQTDSTGKATKSIEINTTDRVAYFRAVTGR